MDCKDCQPEFWAMVGRGQCFVPGFSSDQGGYWKGWDSLGKLESAGRNSALTYLIDSCTGFQLGFDVFGLVLADPSLTALGAESTSSLASRPRPVSPDHLDDLDLLVANASQDHVELSLLFSASAAAAPLLRHSHARCG